GSTWASLPTSPYSQPKHDWDFVNKHLGISSVAPEPTPQFALSSPDSVAPTQGADPAALILQDGRREAEHAGILNTISDIPKAIQYGFQNENSVYNFWVEQGMSQVDPNWVLDEAQARKALEGIPRDQWDYVLQASSAENLSFRRGRVQEALQRQ